jgi:hypothetical protein
VDALLRRVEIDRALDVGGDEPFQLAPAKPNRFAEAAHARPGEADANLGRGRLEVLEQVP